MARKLMRPEDRKQPRTMTFKPELNLWLIEKSQIANLPVSTIGEITMETGKRYVEMTEQQHINEPLYEILGIIKNIFHVDENPMSVIESMLSKLTALYAAEREILGSSIFIDPLVIFNGKTGKLLKGERAFEFFKAQYLEIFEMIQEGVKGLEKRRSFEIVDENTN